MHAAVDRTEIGRKANGTESPDGLKSNLDVATVGSSTSRNCSVYCDVETLIVAFTRKMGGILRKVPTPGSLQMQLHMASLLQISFGPSFTYLNEWPRRAAKLSHASLFVVL